MFLIEPLAVVREGIGLLIETQSDLDVVGHAGSASEGLAQIARLRRRRNLVALVALDMGDGEDPYALIRSIRERFPRVRILASALDADRAVVARALSVGADGFMNKRADPVQFLEGLRRSANGETVITGLPRGLSPSRPETEIGPPPRLTQRQLEIMHLAAEGLTARQMGRRLGLQERTVTTQLTRIYKKLGASGRVNALRAAARHGLISGD